MQTPTVLRVGKVISEVGRGVCSIVTEMCPLLPPEKSAALLNFTLSPVVPFGLPEYEISFAAQNTNTPEGLAKHTLVYPDLNQLTEDHIKLLEEEARLNASLHHDLALVCSGLETKCVMLGIVLNRVRS